MSWVWQHSKAKGTTRLVLLALADHAGADGGDAYPSVGRLAARCGMGERAVQGAIKKLRSLGELEVEPNTGPRGVNRYRIPMTPADPAPPQNVRPADPAPPPRNTCTPPPQESTPPPAGSAPEPSRTAIEPSGNRPSRAAALDGFDEWWEHYPLKKAKGAARAAWGRARKKASVEELVAGAIAYANDPDRKRDYTKHPATWLNAECWTDQANNERQKSKGVTAALRLVERHGSQPRELGA